MANTNLIKKEMDTIRKGAPFFFENAFYLKAQPQRLSKLFCHFEAYKMTRHIPGAIIECGVFKGASLSRFAKMRAIFKQSRSKKIIGFDMFGKFPEADKEGGCADARARLKFISEAGMQSVPPAVLMAFLRNCHVADNIQLIPGDISATLPQYLKKNSRVRFSLVNIDVDLYEPTKSCLECLYHRVMPGGMILLDDYNGFPGATKAINEFCRKNKGIRLRTMPYCQSPVYMVKGS